MAMWSPLVRALIRLGLVEPEVARNAKRRHEVQLANKTVLERRRKPVSDQSGASEAFVTTVAPYEQMFRPLSDDVLQRIRDDAKLVVPFMQFHGIRVVGSWNLVAIDMAFAAWVERGKKTPYSDDQTIEITGAAFGEYCASHLDMEWVFVDDQDGQALGLRGRAVEIQAFPFASVSKRIPDREHGFFQLIFLLLQEQAKSARSREY
jgi:hypothetical protein